MTLGAFIAIIVAVALGVHIGLKVHENPDYLSNLLSILWSLFKLFFLLGIIIIVVGGVINGIWWFFENGDNIELPIWLDRTISVIGMFLILFCIATLIYSWWLGIKKKGGFKKWYKYYKDKKKKNNQAKKDRISNMTEEELKEYKKSKKPGLRFRILIAFPCLILLGIIYLFVTSII